MQSVQLLLGLLPGHARIQSCDHIGKSIRLVHGQWKPDAFVAVPAEARRHNSDYGVRLIIQAQGLAKGSRIAVEQPFPCEIAQYDYRLWLTARPDVGWRDGAAE